MSAPSLPASSLSVALLLSLATPEVAAQENLELGKMWTFENPPLAYLQEEYGFQPDANWLDMLRLASIRFGGGCSSSFVSPKGLILTNHHCVRDNIAQAQGEADWVKDGFYAASLEDEVRLPGLTVQQLVGTEDVTAAMNTGIPEDADGAIKAQRWNENEQALLQQAREDDPNLSYEVVKLFQGAEFQLYSYRIYDDVRLVAAPHLQSAHFGGDPDNFTYPRYSLDFSFCRAWDGDEPADTDGNYFRWNTSGVKQGELVFTTGNPGSTERLLTKAQLEYKRDVYHPIINELIYSNLHVREKMVEDDPSLEKEMRTDILGWENNRKAFDGYYEGLLDESLMEQKAAAEAAFKEKVAADPDLNAKFGDVWDRLAEVAAGRTEIEAGLRFHNTGNHPVLEIAVGLARIESAPELFDQLSALVRQQTQMVGAMPPLRKALFLDQLSRADRWLPENDPYREAVLSAGTPEEILAKVESSKLKDGAFVLSLLEGGAEAIAACEDPALNMGRAILPLMLENFRRNEQLTTMEEAEGERLGRALHAVYGNKVSPDATFTLRFSDGIVDGYPYNGTVAPFQTSFYGLFDRHANFGGEYPFDLPERWIERRDQLDMTTPFNMVSSNDIIGGNSGSPLVNKELEVVGLVFDGNIEMLPNNYLYRGEIPRTVSVHVAAILEALRKVYDASRVVEELVGG